MLSKKEIVEALDSESTLSISKEVPLSQPTIDKAKNGEMSTTTQFILSVYVSRFVMGSDDLNSKLFTGMTEKVGSYEYRFNGKDLTLWEISKTKECEVSYECLLRRVISGNKDIDLAVKKK